MQIEKLDHVNVRTTQLDAMIDWYTNVLGMRIGDRPDFRFPGAWMYTGEAAPVHLVG
ncbi:MAG: VOC family protein, partial [Gammaproteobacteria bacterium]